MTIAINRVALASACQYRQLSGHLRAGNAPQQLSPPPADRERLSGTVGGVPFAVSDRYWRQETNQRDQMRCHTGPNGELGRGSHREAIRDQSSYFWASIVAPTETGIQMN